MDDSEAARVDSKASGWGGEAFLSAEKRRAGNFFAKSLKFLHFGGASTIIVKYQSWGSMRLCAFPNRIRNSKSKERCLWETERSVAASIRKR